MVVVFDTKNPYPHSIHSKVLPMVLEFAEGVFSSIVTKIPSKLELYEVSNFSKLPKEKKAHDSGMLCLLFLYNIFTDVNDWMHSYQGHEELYRKVLCTNILLADLNELSKELADTMKDV